MKNEAIETSQARALNKGQADAVPHLLQQILTRSEDISAQSYEKPIIDAKTHLDMADKHSLMYTQPQMRCLAALLQWRDRVAREEDEGWHYVMPNHVIITICNTMPSDSAMLVACCRPVPDLVRKNAAELTQLINKARREPSSPFLEPMPLSSSASRSSAEPQQDDDNDDAMMTRLDLDVPAAGAACRSSSSSGAGVQASPVQSTEQLYKSAGWVGQDGGPDGPAGIPLFDISALLNAKTPQKPRSGAVTAEHVPSSPFFGGEAPSAARADPMEKKRLEDVEAIRKSFMDPKFLGSFQAQSTAHLQGDAHTTPKSDWHGSPAPLGTPDTGEPELLSSPPSSASARSTNSVMASLASPPRYASSFDFQCVPTDYCL